MRKNRDGRTFTVDPQHRASRLPFIIHRAFKEPGGGTQVMGATGDVVIS